MIRYSRRLVALAAFLALPVLAWTWMVDGFGFGVDHDIDRTAAVSGIERAQLQCLASGIEQGVVGLRLAGIGYGFEPLSGNPDQVIVRTPFQRTLIEFREGGVWKDARFGRGEFVPLRCAPANLATESAP